MRHSITSIIVRTPPPTKAQGDTDDRLLLVAKSSHYGPRTTIDAQARSIPSRAATVLCPPKEYGVRYQPLHHTIVALDVMGSGARGEQLLLEMRSDLWAIVSGTLARQGIELDQLDYEDLGDGLRFVVPATISPTVLLDPFIPQLDLALMAHRRTASEDAQIRLRVAIHHGLLHRDRKVWAGDAMKLTARLLDAAPVRLALAEESDANMVLVVSQAMYESIVRNGYGVDPCTYRMAQIQEKEMVTCAWIHVPGFRAPRLLPAADTTDPPRPADTGVVGPVTNADYRTFVRASGHRLPASWHRSEPYFPDDQESVAVTSISWDDAVAYCDWAGGRLPSGEPPDNAGNTSASAWGHVRDEFVDAGAESDRHIRAVLTGELVDVVGGDVVLGTVGFRCLRVDPPPPTRWVALEAGRFELGADAVTFGRLADIHHLPLSERRLVLGRLARVYDVPAVRMSATCVTNDEYFAYLRAAGGRWPVNWSVDCFTRTGRPFPIRLAGRPVVGITPRQARAYCIWSRTRLPHWFEWERAVSGPTRWRYAWGTTYDRGRSNDLEGGRGSVAAVNEYLAGNTPDGISQMCGNVWELVVGPDGRLEVRGGSYRVAGELWGLAYAFQEVGEQTRGPDIGFRVVGG